MASCPPERGLILSVWRPPVFQRTEEELAYGSVVKYMRNMYKTLGLVTYTCVCVCLCVRLCDSDGAQDFNLLFLFIDE